MKSFQSQIEQRGTLSFPPFTGVRVMMLPFRLDYLDTLKLDQLAPWQNTLRSLCAMSVIKQGVAYLTVDEAVVKGGETHRRPGLHVDGVGEDGEAGGWGGGGGWGKSGMLVAADKLGCVGWNQTFQGQPGANGDAEHLRPQLRDEARVFMEGNQVYWVSPLAVHESLTMPQEQTRQFVRLSMPNDAPWYQGYTESPFGVKPTGEIRAARSTFMNYRP